MTQTLNILSGLVVYLLIRLFVDLLIRCIKMKNKYGMGTT